MASKEAQVPTGETPAGEPSTIENLKKGFNMNVFVQVIIGIVIVIILYVLTLIILSIDSLVVQRSSVVKPKEQVVVIDGWMTSEQIKKRSYNTVNPYVEDFVKIGRSINSRGGAQFTYQFWLKVENVDSSAYKDQVILLKGDNRKYRVGYYDMVTNKLVKQSKPDYMIKCPLIKFGSSYDELIVQINTNKMIEYSIPILMNSEKDISTKRNALSLLPLNWFLLTFVFEDHYSTSESAFNGINFTFYLNDIQYHSAHASDDYLLRGNFLKQNEGNLHILPDSNNGNDFKLANIKYYNYAVSPKEINDTYYAGAPKHNADVRSEKPFKPAYISAYNKMDIYNY